MRTVIAVPSTLMNSFASRWPSVSVVIPVRNERVDRLERCLESVREIAYEGNVDVIVVDDLSDNREDLTGIYRRFAKLENWRVLMRKWEHGKSGAHLEAIRHVAGDSEAILFLDSDTIVDAEAVTHLALGLQVEHRDRVGERIFGWYRQVAAVTGCLGVANADANEVTLAQVSEYQSAADRRRFQSMFGAVWHCPGAFTLVRAEALWMPEILSGYARPDVQQHGEDLWLTLGLLKLGYATSFIESARAVTYVPDTQSDYDAQQHRWHSSMLSHIDDTKAALATVVHAQPKAEVLVPAWLRQLADAYEDSEIARRAFLPFGRGGELVDWRRQVVNLPSDVEA